MTNAISNMLNQIKVILKDCFLFILIQFGFAAIFISLFFLFGGRRIEEINEVIRMSFGVVSGIFSLFFLIKLSTSTNKGNGLFSFKEFFLKSLRKSIFFGCVFAFVLLLSIYCLIFQFGVLKFNRVSFSPLTAIIFFFVFGAGAFMEEMLFRVFIFFKLIRSYPHNNIITIIFTSLFFSLMHSFNPHFNWVPFFNLFLFGVMQSCLIYKYRNFYLIWAVHFFWNYILGVVLGSPVSGIKIHSFFESGIAGNAIITGNGFGVEGSIITTVILILCILFLYFFRLNSQYLLFEGKSIIRIQKEYH